MDEYNAKKSRAHKLKQDKYRDRSKKHVDAAGKAGSKDVSQGKPSAKLVKNENPEKLSNAQNDVENNSSDEDAHEVGQSFSKRKLVNNWNRYEEPVDMSRFEDDGDVNIAKFEELLAIPVSGGHLKLKHEHEWEKAKSELQTPWFQLNIQDMERNLSTIPFYQRQNVAQTFFSESQIQRMATRAKRNAASIQEVNEGILKIQSLSVKNDSQKEVNAKVNTVKHESVFDNCSEPTGKQPPTCVDKPVENDDLDTILALDVSSSQLIKTESKKIEINKETSEEDTSIRDATSLPPAQQSPGLPHTPSADPTPSLDDWLDSILDD